MKGGITAWRMYLYAVTFLSLLVMVIGAVDVCTVLLEVFVYPQPAPYPQPPPYYAGLPRAAAMLLVGFAVWVYHWQVLRKDGKKGAEEEGYSPP
ncbi:DUF5671 domain-containing protein [Methanofollis ethanolicus]|uniref:DUF5671 domain-containing protein n=1 Tax=Methanofollis ethanolicus TaxID=488124 RepID=UPI000833C9AE|nr:DUF5671 domain-containing protein [Methanofollis ethanolicus]